MVRVLNIQRLIKWAVLSLTLFVQFLSRHVLTYQSISLAMVWPATATTNAPDLPTMAVSLRASQEWHRSIQRLLEVTKSHHLTFPHVHVARLKELDWPTMGLARHASNEKHDFLENKVLRCCFYTGSNPSIGGSLWILRENSNSHPMVNEFAWSQPDWNGPRLYMMKCNAKKTSCFWNLT